MSLNAILTHAAFAPLPSVSWIKVTGSDRIRWLNGMVTNSIQALTPGDGCYNFVLNAQGRIQADATAFLREDHLLMETGSAAKLITLLDHFIIMDDVELADLSEERHGLLIAGPNAAQLLAAIGIGAELDELRLANVTWQESPIDLIHASIDLIHAYSPLVPRYELWGGAETMTQLAEALRAAGAESASPDELENLRILEATPLCGTDIRDRDLPQETAQTRALHFAKGCYLGQEIVERIRSRGAVHRMFTAFTLTGELPPVGTALTAEGKAVGELTSVAAIELPSGPVQRALGYVRREALERGATLEYLGGTAVAGE
jgi:aminomethyltransferase